MKKLCIATCILLVATMGAFPGGQKEAVQEAGVSAKGDGILEIWHPWASGGEAEAINALLDGFRKEYPDINLKERVIPGGFEEQRRQLGLAFMGGNPPEVFVANPGYVMKDLAEAGRLTPLTDLWEEINGDKIFAPGIASICKLDNVPWVMPILIHSFHTHYNVKLFEKFNLEEPKTWDEFTHIGKTLKENGIPLIGISWNAKFMMVPLLIETLGAKGYIDLFSGKISWESEGVRKAFEMFKDTWLEYLDENWSGYQWPEAARMVMEEKAGMFFLGDYVAGFMASEGSKPGEDFDAFQAPSPESGEVIIAMLGGFSIPAGSDDPDLAKTFLKYAISNDGQKAFNSHKGSIAVSLETPGDFYNPVQKKTYDLLQKPDTILTASPYLLVPPDFWQLFTNQCTKYALDPTTENLDSALEELEKLRIIKILSDDWVDWGF